MSEVTRILEAIDQRDGHAADELLPLIYKELRQLAAQKLAQERAEFRVVVHQQDVHNRYVPCPPDFGRKAL